MFWEKVIITILILWIAWIGYMAKDLPIESENQIIEIKKKDCQSFPGVAMGIIYKNPIYTALEKDCNE